MRALIVKTSSFGDVVHAFGVVEYLKDQGASHIGWVVEAKIAPLVRAHPLIDTVIEVDSSRIRSCFPYPSFLKEWWRQRSLIAQDQWDLVFDIQGNCKSGLITYSTRSPKKVGYGIKRVAEFPNILSTNCRYTPSTEMTIRDEYLWLVQRFFKDTKAFEPKGVQLILFPEQEESFAHECARWPKKQPIWFIAPGSRWPSKMLSAQSWSNLLEKAHLNPYFIFLAGTASELRLVQQLAERFPGSSHILYRPDPPLLQRLIDKADALLSVDSFVLHLAATTSTPTFGLFGPSSALRYAPQRDKDGWYQAQCPYGEKFTTRCPKLRNCPLRLCMYQDDAQQLVGAFHKWQQYVEHRVLLIEL